ncbi:hypothetical protein [Roseateles toxinivorans]|uniref:Uncharacterized protein n=1 Tax=Roseateles toxinivorans TaxID=270368 RepID=A0A4R6QJ57_9BURK|nr:hypothetical protein [Roseateles toxinivorans]TDP63006.1 hypothetical protein DES47_1055 [Roseateles toxinivorans]
MDDPNAEFEEKARAWRDELAEIARTRWKHIKSSEARAQAVLDQFFKYEDTPYETNDSEDFFNEMQLLDESIKICLDSRSMWHFIELAAQVVISSNASGLAGKRHAENRAMKAEVFAWLDANMAQYKSMDAAAQAIAGVVVPVTFRTARDWVVGWKKLRSAGTP